MDTTPPNDNFLRFFRGDDLLISTTRYYLGRMTAAAGAFAAQLAEAWPTIPSGARSIIRRDIQQQFVDDDLTRSRDEANGIDDPLPLGHDCDRQSWELVRTAWRQQDVADTYAETAATEDAAQLNRL